MSLSKKELMKPFTLSFIEINPQSTMAYLPMEINTVFIVFVEIQQNPKKKKNDFKKNIFSIKNNIYYYLILL